MAWRPGDVILDQYEVLDESRIGGMGMVHRVYHRGWDLDLAVKSPRPDVLTTVQIDNFAAEAEVWVGLGLHPHVVSCVYVRHIDALPRVFAEWVAGGSLAEAISGRHLYGGGPRVATGRILDVAIQTAWGIKHVHDSGLVHQDVKPANVLLANGIAKITDFGLARGLAVPSAPAAGDGTLLAGFGGFTTPYRSPEQASAVTTGGPVRLSRATDVWSWAITVLEMFHGSVPCEDGATARDRLARILADPLGDGMPPLPDGLADLLLACFASDPGERPTIAEAAREVAAIHSRVAGKPYPRQPPDPVVLLADTLSNQALSLLDLGRVEEAQQRWWDALATDQHHAAAGYNAEMHLWRLGNRSDEDVVSEVQAARDANPRDWTPHYLLGLVHRERDDTRQARECLRQAVSLNPGAREAAAALADIVAEESDPIWLTGLSGEIKAMAVSGDGALVVAADQKGTLCAWNARTGKRVRRLARHDPTITTIAVDDAGDIAVIGHSDSRLSLWRPAVQRRPRPFATGADSPATAARLHSGVTTVAISSDGRMVAAGRASGLTDLYGRAIGSPIFTLPGHAGQVSLVALNTAGTLVVTATRPGVGAPSGVLRSWDFRPGLEPTVRDYPAALQKSDHIAVSPDASAAVVVHWGGPLVRWDTRTGAMTGAKSHRIATACHVNAFSSQAELLLSAGGGYHPRFWQPETARCLRSIPGREYGASEGEITGASYSRDGRTAVVALSGYLHSGVRVLRVPRVGYRAPWSYVKPTSIAALVEAATEFRRIAEQTAALLDAGATTDALTALRTARTLPGFARHPELLRLWRRASVHSNRTGVLGIWALMATDGRNVFTQPVTAAISADGDFAITGSWIGHLKVWDLGAGRVRFEFPERSGMARDVAILPDGRAAVSLSSNRTVRVWDLATRQSRELAATSEPATAFAVTRDGRRILTAGAAGTLWQWDSHTGRCLKTVPGNGSLAEAVALDGTGERAGVVSHRLVQVFDLPTGRQLWSFEAFAARISFTPDGGLLILGEPLHLWARDATTGELRYRLDGGGGGVAVFALGADGRLGVTSRHSGGVRVWDLASGRVLRAITDGSIVDAIAVTADSQFAVTGGQDRVVRVWDLRTGECLRLLEGHRARITLVRLSADGHRLITADADQGLRGWELDWDFATTPVSYEFADAPGDVPDEMPTFLSMAWLDIKRWLGR